MNSKQGNPYHFSSFPWVRVHAFEFNALQVTFSFIYTTFQEVLDMVPFSSQTWVTPEYHIAYYMSEFSLWIENTKSKITSGVGTYLKE